MSFTEVLQFSTENVAVVHGIVEPSCATQYVDGVVVTAQQTSGPKQEICSRVWLFTLAGKVTFKRRHLSPLTLIEEISSMTKPS